mmetsp:Transcript_6749/g.24323  ORF Transcript_6749/g.24323 Transcript_6749/m.24323 type:complete len:287 (+) Transcript_6749:35-895(+)
MSRIQFKSKSTPGPLFVRVLKLLDDLVVVEGQGHGSVHSPGPPGRVPDGAMVRRAPDGVHHPAEDMVPGIDGAKGPAVRGQSLPAILVIGHHPDLVRVELERHAVVRGGDDRFARQCTDPSHEQRAPPVVPRVLHQHEVPRAQHVPRLDMPKAQEEVLGHEDLPLAVEAVELLGVPRVEHRVVGGLVASEAKAREGLLRVPQEPLLEQRLAPQPLDDLERGKRKVPIHGPQYEVVDGRRDRVCLVHAVRQGLAGVQKVVQHLAANPFAVKGSLAERLQRRGLEERQ